MTFADVWQRAVEASFPADWLFTMKDGRHSQANRDEFLKQFPNRFRAFTEKYHVNGESKNGGKSFLSAAYIPNSYHTNSGKTGVVKDMKVHY